MENNAIFVTEPEIFKTHLVKRLDVLSMNDGYTLKLTFNEMNGKGELGFFGKLETINNAIQGDLLLYTKEM